MSPKSLFTGPKSILLIISPRSHRILYVGDVVRTVLGYETSLFLGRRWDAVTPILAEEYRSGFELAMKEYVQGIGRLTAIVKVRKSSGKTVACEVGPFDLPPGLIGECLITCRFASHGTAARARERGSRAPARRDFARELHDGMAQDLFLCKGKLVALRAPGSESDRRRLLADALSCFDETTARFRGLLTALPAVHSGTSGLRGAMMGATRWARRTYGLEVTFRVKTALPFLDDPSRSLVLSATREFLTNVFKHSGQKTARVMLGREGDAVRLDVLDFGSGIGPAAAAGRRRLSPGLGLPAIGKRAAELGGAVEIESAPGAHTRVSLILPGGGSP